jgi:hypothetical protein
MNSNFGHMDSISAPVAQVVREYISARPAIHDALTLGIVNQSALARRIMEAEGLDRHDAVLKALTRLQTDLKPPKSSGNIHQALAESRLEVRTRVAMLTCNSSWQVLEAVIRRAQAVTEDDERIHILHGWDALTVVADESILDDLQAVFPKDQIIEYRKGLAELNIRTSNALDHVPGFIAFTAGALSERGINVIDATTCRRDHIFLVDQSDLTDAVTAIEACLE